MTVEITDNAVVLTSLWKHSEVQSNVQRGRGIHISENTEDGMFIIRVYDYKGGKPGPNKILSVALTPEDKDELIKHLQS